MPSMFTSWFQRREAARKRSALTAASRNKGRRVFLALEALEDRYVPTTLAVTTAADNVNLAGSLRYELAQANNGDVIEIETSQTIVLTQGELYLNKDLTIEGMGQEKTISGDLLFNGLRGRPRRPGHAQQPGRHRRQRHPRRRRLQRRHADGQRL